MTMRRGTTSLVPPQLEPLLTTPFFSICSTHTDDAINKRNMFCLDCEDVSSGVFCLYCRSERHAGLCMIQIRRLSCHNVVRGGDPEGSVDQGEFIRMRPTTPECSFSTSSPNHVLAVRVYSRTHVRSALDPFQFCSLACKLVGIKCNGGATFVPPEDEEEERPAASSTSGRSRRWEEGAEEHNKMGRSREFRFRKGQPADKACREKKKKIVVSNTKIGAPPFPHRG